MKNINEQKRLAGIAPRFEWTTSEQDELDDEPADDPGVGSDVEIDEAGPSARVKTLARTIKGNVDVAVKEGDPAQLEGVEQLIKELRRSLEKADWP
jgi:hypothetical protein